MNQKSIIKTWVKDSAEQLAEVGIETALLDAEIILAYTLRKPRTYLYAHGDDDIPTRELESANARLDLRLARTPIAYITGVKEFYGRDFEVNQNVLIPRAESEAIIDSLNQLQIHADSTLLDIGTGCGCLGITAKLELPKLHVALVDVSQPSLTIATKNADRLGADVAFIKNDLLKPNNQLPPHVDIILANLPYVDIEWQCSPETRYEPAQALYADRGGLELIYQLIVEAPDYLTRNGYLLLEADTRQHQAIVKYATSLGYSSVQTNGFCLVFQYN